ncbi:hypothetical protein Ocin01_16067 [Orchesella cincta]|uniref:C-type lectin domain-containing protein n=1 Tax=Orchesella cincta TaxID=48709 RepID=A0A1D2MCK3_ORCCI|nr:hypothetical protein Ocin01_16067 [Orchesella cincta]
MKVHKIICSFPISISFVIFLCKSSAAVNHTVPEAKVLNFFADEDKDLESRAGNKSQKVLTRPLKPQPTTTQNPYFFYPQNPGFIGDSYGQGSGLHPNVQQPPPNNGMHHGMQQHQHQPQAADKVSSEIPAIYIQLIEAIEKLVARMDKIDNRLRTAENILYHMTNKKEELPEQGSCPNNFKKVDGVRGKCFQVSSFTKDPEVYDWKSAENQCTKSGGRLVEMLNYDDFLRVSQFLIKYNSASNSATSDYWIGGINPGLIWIWAESGQPVDMNKRFWNDNDNGSALPGCLKLSYSHRLNTYFFKHSPCGHSQNFICEILDNTVSRALARFEAQLWEENETVGTV